MHSVMFKVMSVLYRSPRKSEYQSKSDAPNARRGHPDVSGSCFFLTHLIVTVEYTPF